MHPMKPSRCLITGLALLAAGCAWNGTRSRDPFVQPSAPLPDAAVPAAPGSQISDLRSEISPSGVWTTHYESTQHRGIATLQLGAPGGTFITGSLYGDDPASVRVLDALAARLAVRPNPETPVLLLRTPNPDGLAAGTRWNHRDVDLNRNFPSRRFVPDPDSRTGAAPASEVETCVVMRLLGEYQPARVVHVRTANLSVPLVYAGGRPDPSLDDRLDAVPLERGRFDEIAATGSLERFAAQRLRAEVLTIVIPASGAARPETTDLLLTLCGIRESATGPSHQQSPQSAPPPIAETPAEPPRPAVLTGTLEPDGPDGEHGYVELLPPPPIHQDDSERDARFYELPPPS